MFALHLQDSGAADDDDTEEPSKEQAGIATDKPSMPAGPKAIPIDSEAMSAFIKAQKIIQNLDLQYKGNGDGSSGENHFVEELEINDYPQMARWKVTQKEASDSVAELTGAAVITRGSFIPAGRKPNPSERKLYLVRNTVSIISITAWIHQSIWLVFVGNRGFNAIFRYRGEARATTHLGRNHAASRPWW